MNLVKHYTMTTLMLIFTISVMSQNTYFQWVSSNGGLANEKIYSVSTDASGNVYTTGFFESTMDFDPEESIFEIEPMGTKDMFIQKQDSLGNFLWAKSIGGSISAWGWSITNDPSGNIYVCGGYKGSVDFDPDDGSEIRVSNGDHDAFILKLDTDGNFMWVNSYGSEEPEIAYTITIDESTNILVSGWFEETVDFDSGANIFNLTSNGSNDGFIVKVDADGEFIWAGNIGGPWGDAAHSITTDLNNNIIVTCFFSETVDMDPGIDTFNITSSSANDIAIIKLDSLGGFLWAKAIGGYGHDTPITIKADIHENIFLAGIHNTFIDFDPGEDISILGPNGSFILKLDPSGNFEWAKSLGGQIGAVGRSIDTDKSDNLYLTGKFSDTTNFNELEEGYELTAEGLNDAFVMKLDYKGDILWIETFGGDNEVDGYCINVDQNDNVYIGGFYNGTADFDPSSDVFNLSSNGEKDFFIMKLSQKYYTTATHSIRPNNRTLIYPNPFNNQINIATTLSDIIAIKVFDSNGKLLMEEENIESPIQQYILDQSPGVYIVEVYYKDKKEQIQLIKK